MYNPIHRKHYYYCYYYYYYYYYYHLLFFDLIIPTLICKILYIWQIKNE